MSLAATHWGCGVGQQISRRQLLGRGAAAGLGGLAFASLGSAGTVAAEEPSVVSGILGGVEGAQVAWIRPLHYSAAQSSVRVEFNADASFWRDRAANLEDFVTGDEVVAEGSWNGDVFLSSRLEVLNRIVEGQVEERRSQVLDTNQGDVQLVDITEPEGGPDLEAKPLDQLREGHSILARGRADAQTGRLIAYRVGVKA